MNFSSICRPKLAALLVTPKRSQGGHGPAKIIVAVCPMGRWPPCGVHLAKFLEKRDCGFRSERNGIWLPTLQGHREHRNGDSDSRACFRQTARLATSIRCTQTIPESFASWLTRWRHCLSASPCYSAPRKQAGFLPPLILPFWGGLVTSEVESA